MDKYKLASALLLGVVVGMACGDSIEDSANAQGSQCSHWSVRVENIDDTLDEDWEPFAWNRDEREIAVRRCED